MTAIDILSLGEPLIEFVRLPDGDGPAEPGTHRYRSGVGGDALNVLVAAARQGGRAGLISAVGNDPLGEDILAFCAAEGIDTHAVRVDDRHPTGSVHILPDPEARRFHYARLGSAASHVGPSDLPPDMIAEAKALHVTGVSLAISETMRDAAFRAAEMARRAGALVSFDLNYRARLWPREKAREVIEAFLPLADIVLPSADEASDLIGLADPRAVLGHYGRHGARLVVLKRGAAGALLAIGTDIVEVPAVPVRPVDSSGAGDSFAGALLAHLLETGDPFRAATAAAAVAAATVTGWGATDAIPRRNAPKP